MSIVALRRPGRRRHPRVRAGGVAVVGLILLGGCGQARTADPPASTATTVTAPAASTGTTAPATTTPVPATSATTTPPATVAPTVPVTVAPLPSTPQVSPDAASAALIDDWEGGRRAAAGTVATARAVATLFERRYAGQTLNNRQCSTSFRIVCTWGPYGGANPADAVYEIRVAESVSGWYVSSVAVES